MPQTDFILDEFALHFLNVDLLRSVLGVKIVLSKFTRAESKTLQRDLCQMSFRPETSGVSESYHEKLKRVQLDAIL